MRIPLTYPQWLFFWLFVCMPLTLNAADVAAKVADKAAAVNGVLPARADFAFAEPYFSTLEQGKTPSPIITALLQDAQGWLWIGTQHGLYRYDGYRMRRFAHDPANPASLAGDNITALWQAADGRLWVGTNSDGVSIFDPGREQFTHLRHEPGRATSLAGGAVWALVGDAGGGVWIGTNHGLDYAAPGGAPLRQYRHEPNNPASLLDNQIRSLLLDKQGTLWVGSIGGLQRYQTARPTQTAGFVRVASDPTNPASLAGKELQTLFQAQDGKLWLGTHKQGAAWLNPAEPEPALHWLPVQAQRADRLSHASVTSIIEAQAGQIWLGTYGGGINIVAAQDGAVLQRLQHDPANGSSLAHNAIRLLVRDQSGVLWLGTAGGGLQRHHPAQQAFKVLRHHAVGPRVAATREAAGLSHPEVRSVLELADGRILVGTGGNGIDILDRKRGVVGGYRPNQPGGLPDGTIRALMQTPDGTLWAGSQQAGVLRLLPGSTRWQAITQGLPSAHVRKFLLDRKGVLWVATANGIARWEAGHQRFVAQQQPDGSALQAYVMALAEDRQGRLWAASNHGLWLKTPQASGWQAILHQSGQPDSLPSNDVWVLWVDASDRLWVNSAKGLVRLQQWDGRKAVFEAVSAKAGAQGLGRNGVPWQDRQGRIWLNTALLLQPAPDTVHFAENNQPEIGTHWFGANGLTHDGLLMLGGSQGLAIFDPAKFEPWTFQPPVRITELKINGQSTAPGARLPRLRLTHDQRNFSLEFAALDFSQSDQSQTRYRYRLQGYDQNWINTDHEHRMVSYGNLWPGSYTLQVQGSNSMGGWSRHELHLPIQVLPAWWQTWWFGVVLLLSLGACMALLLQTRTRYLRQRQRELEQLVEQRTSQLRLKQAQLVGANHELNQSNTALNESNAELALSVETLRQLSQIGREITANLDADIVFQSLYLYVGGLLHAPTMTIYRMNASATALEAVFVHDDDDAMPPRSIALDSPTSNSARAVRERQELLLHFEPPDEPQHHPGPRQMRTALFAPLIVDDRVLGVMSIQSERENAFCQRERLIFRTLTAYGAIALANASAIAALRQAQGQLVQQEKMASLGGLVVGIAHQINTPLGNTLVALSGAEGAWRTLERAIASGSLSKSALTSTTSEGIEYTVLAQKTANRAAELIALFKTISVNADRNDSMVIELANYLHEMATLVHGRLVQIGCKLDVVAPAGLTIWVVADALSESLSRILVNTLDHGFTDGRTGTLRLTAQMDKADDGDDEVVITVSDDGHGIAPEHLPKVFDPFFTTKSGMRGHVGLGLYVAYNHVTERLKGNIHITSTLGVGTCVSIRLRQSAMQKTPNQG